MGLLPATGMGAQPPASADRLLVMLALGRSAWRWAAWSADTGDPCREAGDRL